MVRGDRGSGVEGVDIAWPPTFSFDYTTPLLQYQAQLGLNPALPGAVVDVLLPGAAEPDQRAGGGWRRTRARAHVG